MDYTSQDNPKKITGAKVGDTLTVAIDLRTDYDNLQFFVNGNSLGTFAKGISSKANKLYFTGNLFKVGEVVITSCKVDGVM